MCLDEMGWPEDGGRGTVWAVLDEHLIAALAAQKPGGYMYRLSM